MTTGVILCTHNGSKYLKEQLLSILNQDYPIDEILIFDDCSSDNTKEILTEFAQFENIFIHFNEKKFGVVKNFEQGIVKSKADIIFFSDQDDVWITNKVSETVAEFDKNPNCLALFSDAFLIDENGFKLKDSLWDRLDYREIQINRYEYIVRNGNMVTGAGLAIRSDTKKLILPFPASLNMLHDEWIALRLSSLGCINPLNKKLFFYRIHKDQHVGISINPNSELINNNLGYYYKIYIRSKYLSHISPYTHEFMITLKREFIKEKNNFHSSKSKYFKYLRELKWKIEGRYNL